MYLPVKLLQRRTESEPHLNALFLWWKLPVHSHLARIVGAEEGTPSLPQRIWNLLMHSFRNTSTRWFCALNKSVPKWFLTELDSPGWLLSWDALRSRLQKVFYARRIFVLISSVLAGRSNMFRGESKQVKELNNISKIPIVNHAIALRVFA